MTGNEYQRLAMVTAASLDNKQKQMNAVLGLNGESGEVADIYKKATFQGHSLDKKHVAEEIGDVMWYCALMASGLGTDLNEIMENNINKLKARYPEGFSAERSVNR